MLNVDDRALGIELGHVAIGPPLPPMAQAWAPAKFVPLIEVSDDQAPAPPAPPVLDSMTDKVPATVPFTGTIPLIW